MVHFIRRHGIDVLLLMILTGVLGTILRFIIM